MTVRHATYSVLIGSYETLNEQTQLADRGEGDFILFTDDPELTSSFWDVRVIEPEFPYDPVRSQRMLKVRPGALLDGYDTTLYVDNTVTLRAAPAAIAAEWLADPEVDVALPLHSFRETLLDEFDELLLLQLDEPSRITEQLEHYAREAHPSLEQRPYWTALLARRASGRLDAAMSLWADQLLRYSRRDQLSVRYALDARVRVNAVELDNHDSAVHSWPTSLRRKAAQGRAYGRGAGPLLADLRRAWREVAERDQRLAQLDLLQREAEDAVASGEAAQREAREAIAAAQQAQTEANDLVSRAVSEAQQAQADAGELQEAARLAIIAAEERVAAASAELSEAQAQRDALAAQLAEIQSSAAWKVTAPLRQRKPKG